MSTNPVIKATWENASELVHAELARRRNGRAVLVVGVTGPVGAGKTSLARRLGGLVLSTDDYLPDYDRLPREEWDNPDHADLGLLGRHLAELAAGRAAEVPTWSFHSHSREGFRLLSPPQDPAALVVCEGIHALHSRVRSRLDLAVYVEAPADVRWERCEKREMTGDRGWGVEAARTFFVDVAEPTFSRWSDEYRAAADVLVINAQTR